MHHVLLETVLKHLMQLISGWQSRSIHSYGSTRYHSDVVIFVNECVATEKEKAQSLYFA